MINKLFDKVNAAVLIDFIEYGADGCSAKCKITSNGKSGTPVDFLCSQNIFFTNEGSVKSPTIVFIFLLDISNHFSAFS